MVSLTFSFLHLESWSYSKQQFVYDGQHDCLCKNESKCMFRDVKRKTTYMLFVEQPDFISVYLTVLNQALHFLILLQFSFARITILLKSVLFK